jgi:hypothetical protein
MIRLTEIEEIEKWLEAAGKDIHSVRNDRAEFAFETLRRVIKRDIESVMTDPGDIGNMSLVRKNFAFHIRHSNELHDIIGKKFSSVVRLTIALRDFRKLLDMKLGQVDRRGTIYRREEKIPPFVMEPEEEDVKSRFGRQKARVRKKSTMLDRAVRMVRR